MNAMFISWFYYCFIFGAEIFIFCYFYGRLSLRKNPKLSFTITFFIALLSYYSIYTGILSLEYCFLWALILISILFRGSILLALKRTIIVLMLESFIESLFWTIGMIFINDKNIASSLSYNLIIGTITFFIIIFCTILLKKTHKIPFQLLSSKLSIRQNTLLVVGLMSTNIFFATLQGFFLEEMVPSLQKWALISCVITILLMFGTYISLIYTTQKKNYLEALAEINEKYHTSQQKYFEKTTETYENLRHFRHDIKHHLFIIQHYAEENSYEKISKYINQLNSTEALQSYNYTGNDTVDALFYDIFKGHLIENDITFHFYGSLPNNFYIPSFDLCTIFANIFQNALEELNKQENNRYFELEIKQNDKEYIFNISNSIRENVNTLDFSKTTKKDTQNHGLGIENIKSVSAL